MHIGAAQIQPDQTGHDEAWQLLERMYRQKTGGVLPAVERTALGKPYFLNSPWHFSLTHTKGHVFCVLSQKPVGIDAEEEDRKINLALADKILSPGERAQYDAAADKRLALLTFWVLKEAQKKCTGQGLQGYPKDTDFSLEDPRVQKIDGCLVAVIEEDDHVI
jgi:phosphopantetheinyl transferase